MMQAVGLVRSSSPDPQSSTFSGNQEADLGVFETGTTPPVLGNPTRALDGLPVQGGFQQNTEVQVPDASDCGAYK